MIVREISPETDGGNGSASLASTTMWQPHPVRWLREHPRGADLLLALLVTAMAIVGHVVGDGESDDPEVLDPTWWTTIIAVATAVPIYWRRTYPLRSGLFVVAVQCGALLIGIEGAAFLGSTVAIYSIGAHSSGPRRTHFMTAIGAMILMLFVAGWLDGQNLISEFIGTIILLVTAFVLGDNMRRRRDHVATLAERAERAEREQELIAERRVNAERTRIARELHDVVAHSVSVMVIQAAAARRNLGDDIDRAEGALAAIEDTGRQTMTELRAILGVLRSSDTDQDPRLRPQPTLADIDALLGRDDDLPVELIVGDDIGELPQSVMLTGYRVVQEALTNVRRHAGPVEHVEVRVDRHGDRLVVSVLDDGRGAAADDVGSGYGIVGMIERVSAIGGEIETGPRAGGGWRVRVSLPIDQQTAVRRPVANEAERGRAPRLPEPETTL